MQLFGYAWILRTSNDNRHNTCFVSYVILDSLFSVGIKSLNKPISCVQLLYVYLLLSLNFIRSKTTDNFVCFATHLHTKMFGRHLAGIPIPPGCLGHHGPYVPSPTRSTSSRFQKSVETYKIHIFNMLRRVSRHLVDAEVGTDPHHCFI